MQKMERIADFQADIRNSAEKANVALQKRGYVSQDLAAAIDRMKLVEDKLRNHRGSNYTSDMHAVTTNLGIGEETAVDRQSTPTCCTIPVHAAPI